MTQGLNDACGSSVDPSGVWGCLIINDPNGRVAAKRPFLMIENKEKRLGYAKLYKKTRLKISANRF